MQSFEKLHHINIFSFASMSLDMLKSKMFEFGFETLANPDYSELSLDVFGIEEARKVSEWAFGKPITGDRKIIVIKSNTLTQESQNALLKTLEEPPKGTYFFFILSNTEDLLPTFLSRCFVYKGEENIKDSTLSQLFFNSSLGQRVEIIKKYSQSKEDKNDIKNIIDGLEVVLDKSQNFENITKLKKVIMAKKLSSARGSSPKMLLEWLCTYI